MSHETLLVFDACVRESLPGDAYPDITLEKPKNSDLELESSTRRDMAQIWGLLPRTLNRRRAFEMPERDPRVVEDRSHN